MSHSWVQDYFKVLKYLVIEKILKLLIIALLINTILSLLPELIRDIVVGEALTVEH
jgi:hypothetical protein